MSCGTCLSSGRITENTQLVIGRNMLRGVVLTAESSSQGQIRVYDQTDEGPVDEDKLLIAAHVDGAVNKTESILFDCPVRATEGLRVVIQGTPSRAIVYFGS